MRPIVIVLLDGLGDRAYPELGGETANEAAATPSLDALAGRASNGLLWPLGPGRAPSSELAHWAMLGYRDGEFPGRAVLEARGSGLSVQSDQVYGYATLRPAESRGGCLWVTGRPSPEDATVAAELLGTIESREADGLAFTLSGLAGGQAILAVSGAASAMVTDTDPFFRDRDPVLKPRPIESGAERTARAIEDWSLWAHRRLEEHPINRDRRREDKPALNVVTLKWWGQARCAPSFAERHGLTGAIVGGSTFLAGLAETLGLDYVPAPETEAPQRDLTDRLERVAGLLDGGASFVLSHQKALDEAGHTKRAGRRVETIEALDAAVPALDRDALATSVVCVTGDHATPASPEVIHSGDPVPFLVVGGAARSDDVARFGERYQASGILGRLHGEDVMPVLLNAADRPRFLGSRPTNVDGAAGHPSRVEPLRVEDAVEVS